MNLIKTISLLFTFIFCSCSTVVTHGLTFEDKALFVDTSGMMVDYGGQLINKRQSLFCTHWDILGMDVTFIARNGEKVKRRVIKMDKLGLDLCIITFDKDLDPKQHWFAPVADIDKDTTATVFRYRDRHAIVVEVQNDYYYEGMFNAEHNSFPCKPGKSIRPGDSGKGWYAMVDGKIHLIGINSYISMDLFRQEPIRAFSPEVGEIYEKYLKGRQSQ